MLPGSAGQAILRPISESLPISRRTTEVAENMNKERRQLIKVLCFLPWSGTFVYRRKTALEAQLESDFVLVDGWILKKTDLTDYLA